MARMDAAAARPRVRAAGRRMSAPAKAWHSPGPCPFLTCLITEPHDHPVCPECHAVRYGNIFYCATCNAVFNAEQAANGRDPIPLAGDA